ncbi:MAG: hypothetical protein ABSD31_12475, partial [Candidatus Binataceae bacterium]
MTGVSLIVVLIGTVSPAFATPLLVHQPNQDSVLEVPSINYQQPNDEASTDSAGPGPAVQIPQRFAGCWAGEVSQSDLTQVNMITKPMIGAWLTKQYRVCFVQEATGLKASLVASSVERHELVLQAQSMMTPVFANAGAVGLLGELRMVEQASNGTLRASYNMSGETGDVVEERVQLKGSLDYRGVMRVEGRVKGYYNG